MGDFLLVGVLLPESRGDSIIMSITSNEGLLYFCFGCCAASTGGGVKSFCVIMFKDLKLINKNSLWNIL